MSAKTMTIQNAYDAWAKTYNNDVNTTRDLDQYVTQRILTQLAGLNILEIGCGTGKNTKWLAQHAESVLALDFSEGMLKKAKADIPFSHVSFKQHDITTPWPSETQAVDLVVGNLVLEHIEALSFIFDEAYRVLKPGGKFFLCELHPYRQLNGVQAKFQAKDGKETKIVAYIHAFSAYIQEALAAGFLIAEAKEWWDDPNSSRLAIPRLVSFLFCKEKIQTRTSK